MTMRRTRPLLVVAVLLCAWCATAEQPCPDCGRSPVPYPLSTGPTCGHPSYKIRCDAGALHFDTLNASYPIKSIDPATRRLVIRPADFVGNTCVTSDFSKNGVQLNRSLPFNITSDNTVFYLDCNESILNSPLDCSPTSPCRVYVNGTLEGSACSDAPICCTFKTGGSATAYMIRVRPTGCKAYRSFVNLDPTLRVTRWGEPGLEIQWFQPE